MHRRGWAHYVEDLEARDASGALVTLDADSGAVWTLRDATTRRIRLSYRVDLSFATRPWPYGNEQAGTLQGHDVFVVSKALFITLPP